MAVTSIVSMPVADIHKKYDFVAKVTKAFKKFSRGKSLINPKKTLCSCSHGQYPGKPQSVSLSLRDREHSLITNRSGESFVVGVLGNRLIPFDVP